jgi:hypothetical protein
MTEPRVAVTLLQAFGRDEALVGDILEEFEHRQSRAWLWRQVAVVVLFGLPHGLIRRRSQQPRMPLPVGGFGFLAIAVLITSVAPGAWWFVGLGMIGGLILGAVLVANGRRGLADSDGRRDVHITR